MNLGKTGPRGEYKVAYCEELHLAAFQWCDCKVVNCVSSYLDFGVSTVYRQVGPDRTSFGCPGALVAYQQNMGGVDRGDQMRAHFGGFAGQSHFKKWYKKTVMAILDCMLVNGLLLWNLSAEKMDDRFKLTRYNFMHMVADKLMVFETKLMVSPPAGSKGS